MVLEIRMEFDESKKLADNAMLQHRRELFYEWDFEKNDELDIYRITKGSETMVWWECPDCKSSYDMNVYSRVNRHGNCPYCAGRRVNHTNSLASLEPEISSEWHPTKNRNLTPHSVTKSSNKKAWWICTKCESEYDMTINGRTSNKNCPYCAGKRVNKTNSLQTLRPDLVKEWHLEKNKNNHPSNVSVGSNKKVWWSCSKCNSEWSALISSRVYGSNCPFCEGVKVNETNCLLKRYPKISLEWHKTLNKNAPNSIHCHSGKKAWWNCLDCGSEYSATVYHRTFRRQNCPYCAGVKVNQTNSLATLYPSIAKEWHPTKNTDLTPHTVTSKNDRKVWWLGSCGHEWDAKVSDRTAENCGCPYCSNHRVQKGFNDMWTTNPDLAKLLANHEDGFKFTQSSDESVDWECRECRTVVKNRRVRSVKRDGLTCPRCSDGTRFPEKFMYNLLKESDIEFTFDSGQVWSQGKRYDFYLPEYNWIIEVHGRQHYDGRFSNFDGGRTLKDEQENDSLKEQIANNNGIAKYIVIDARESTVEWLKNSILNSDIINIAQNIDFEQIGQLSSKSFIKDVCNLWNTETKVLLEIAEKMRLHPATVSNYLKRGAEIGWCDYFPVFKRSIVQLSRDGEFMKDWESIAEANNVLGINGSHISATCRGTRKTAGNFKWMYREDYDISM